MELLQEKTPNKFDLLPNAWCEPPEEGKQNNKTQISPNKNKTKHPAYPKQQFLQTFSGALVTQQKEQRSDLSILRLK